MHKAGGPRRPDAELSWQVTRCSCRTRRSRPTQRRQCTKQVVRGVPTRNKVPPCDGKAQGRWSAASRRGTKSAGHSLLMPRPEVAAHPATAKRKAGGPRRPDAEQSRQVTRCSCRARRSRPTQRRQCTKQVVRGVPTRNKAGRSLVAHAAPGGHGPPRDGKVQGRWSAASRRGTKSAGHSLLMPRPEVTAHPATVMRKAGGPRRPDAELSRQVTRCSCRARRSRPTLRRQCTRQVVRGVPTRNKVGRSLLAHAAPGGRGPPYDGNAQGRWSAASRRGTKTAGHSLLMPRPEVTAHPATAMRKAGGPRRPDAELSWQVTRCSCRARRSRPTEATAMHKAGGPRRPDAEQRRQDTRCSCRARRSRPTQATAMHKAGGPRRPDAELIPNE